MQPNIPLIDVPELVESQDPGFPTEKQMKLLAIGAVIGFVISIIGYGIHLVLW